MATSTICVSYQKEIKIVLKQIDILSVCAVVVHKHKGHWKYDLFFYCFFFYVHKLSTDCPFVANQ